MNFSDINLLDRDRFTQGIPHEWFTFLRENEPVWKHPEPDGPGFWVVTKHADVITVGRDGKTFSSSQARGGVVGLEEEFMENGYDSGNAEMSELMKSGEFNMMLMMDDPEHTRYRRLVNKGFTPRMISELEPHIRDLTNAIIDSVIERGECDFVVDVAAELTLQIIAEMLGVVQGDRAPDLRVVQPPHRQ